MMRKPRFSPEALLFDMDGLLVDSEPVWMLAEKELAASRGAVWTDEQALGCVGKGLPNTLLRMRDELGIDLEPERGIEELVDRFIANAAQIPLKKGALALLDGAASRRLALVTSSPRRLVDVVLRTVGVSGRFQAILTAESVQRPKPAPDIYLTAMKSLEVKPASAVVFEDSLAGATAGWSAGAYVIAVPEGDPGGRGFEAVAHHVVSDLDEARALLAL